MVLLDVFVLLAMLAMLDVLALLAMLDMLDVLDFLAMLDMLDVLDVMCYLAMIAGSLIVLIVPFVPLAYAQFMLKLCPFFDSHLLLSLPLHPLFLIRPKGKKYWRFVLLEFEQNFFFFFVLNSNLP